MTEDWEHVFRFGLGVYFIRPLFEFLILRGQMSPWYVYHFLLRAAASAATKQLLKVEMNQFGPASIIDFRATFGTLSKLGDLLALSVCAENYKLAFYHS